MKKLLILYPHWPPSNLAGVHRSRLIANYSQDFGWDVTVLTVDEAFYEEPNDPEIERLVAPHINVEKVNAFPVFKILGHRILGDIGIRGWIQMRRKMLEILRSEKIDFVWIPIPSWYTSLLGRIAFRKLKVPFGIDYIDPWVYQLTKYERIFSRQWWTRQVALVLEPIAIRKASLISGVSEEYYSPALNRVFVREVAPHSVAMPYGFDPNDHNVEPSSLIIPWGDDNTPYLLYAGAYLPHSEVFIREFFQIIQTMKVHNRFPLNLKLRFVGTGKRAGMSISDLASEYNITELVEEYPDRIPFLSVQVLLRRAMGCMIIGSTESHYTASKTFQCLLSERPVFAIFHKNSSATAFMEEVNAGNFLVKWYRDDPIDFAKNIDEKLSLLFTEGEKKWHPDLEKLGPYSSKESSRILFKSIEDCTKI